MSDLSSRSPSRHPKTLNECGVDGHLGRCVYVCKSDLDRVLPSADNDLRFYFSSHLASQKRLWRSLMDRGANGCIFGSDVRIVNYYDEYVDLNGIDDHTVRNLQLAEGCAYAMTDHGPCILHIHQGAAMSDVMRYSEFWTVRFMERFVPFQGLNYARTHDESCVVATWFEYDLPLTRDVYPSL